MFLIILIFSFLFIIKLIKHHCKNMLQVDFERISRELKTDFKLLDSEDKYYKYYFELLQPISTVVDNKIDLKEVVGNFVLMTNEEKEKYKHILDYNDNLSNKEFVINYMMLNWVVFNYKHINIYTYIYIKNSFLKLLKKELYKENKKIEENYKIQFSYQ